MNWWDKYLGIPFLTKGRDEKGCDCWGLVRLIYKNELNIDLPDYDSEYQHSEQRELLSNLVKSEWHSNWEKIENRPQPFDVAVLLMNNFPMHVGIVTKEGYMLHCLKGINTVHERLTGIRWNNKINGYARLIK